jgi:hypothetical protein
LAHLSNPNVNGPSSVMSSDHTEEGQNCQSRPLKFKWENNNTYHIHTEHQNSYP